MGAGGAGGTPGGGGVSGAWAGGWEGCGVVEQAYAAPVASDEAARCLACDLREFDVDVNPVVCKDCGYCQEVCGLDVFDRSDRFNDSGYLPMVATRAGQCVGCLNCLYICPDFAITITERRSQPHGNHG